MKSVRLVAVTLLLALAGCGVARQAEEPAPASSGTATTGQFPVEVAHKYGTTTIPAKPQRVVTLGLSDQDAVFQKTDPNQARSRLAADPVFQGLKAVKENRVLWVPYSQPAIGAAMSFNTVLSVPYALREFVPLLEKA